MSIEIERKFLVDDTAWQQAIIGTPGIPYCQGYLSLQANDNTVRVRIQGEEAYLTIKGGRRGISRLEFEYPIPPADARILQTLCKNSLVFKTRYRLHHQGFIWEIDEFYGENEGLVTAEVELEYHDTPIDLPSWVGKEVSDDLRYSNSYLALHPFKTWKSHATSLSC